MDEEIVVVLEKIERKRLLGQIQIVAEEEGHISSMPPLLLRKMANPLQYTGGILLGIFLGIFTLVFNFLLFVFLLHCYF